MPYKLLRRDGKYCMENTKTGRVYCYKSARDRKKGMRLHEAFAHGFKKKVAKH